MSRFIQVTARYASPTVSKQVYVAVDKIIAVSASPEEGAGSNIELVDGADRAFIESVSEVMEAIHNG